MARKQVILAVPKKQADKVFQRKTGKCDQSQTLKD